MADTKTGFSEEEKAYLKEQLAEVERVMGTKAADQIKNNLEAAITAFKEKELAGFSELKQWQVDAKKQMDENQKWIDKKVAEGNTIQIVAPGDQFKSELQKAFTEKKEALAGYGKTRSAISFEMKTVGDIATGNFTVSGTHGFVNPGELSAPGRKPYESRHIRELMRVTPIGPMSEVYVVRDTGGEGAPTSVAPGVAKPQSDRDWVKTIVPITKIAHYYKIPEEYLADIVWLQDEITGVGVEELLTVEDTMILTNSAGGEFLGLNQTFNSTAYSTPSSLAGIFTGAVTANNYDVLVAAWTQNRILKSNVTDVLMHPADYARMILTKDTTGQYPFGAPNQNIPNLFGAPIFAHTAVTSDKFFLGDFKKGRIGVRAGLTVRFYDQNEDDAITNMVTVVIEERITMAMDRADRIIYGDFSDARTAIES
jgi:HK97 family phage major capsid protein